jgi:DNA polymerase III sliding clamp (beta) subunit (PCNA family)
MLLELPRPIFKAAIERLSVLNENGKVKVDAYTHIRLEVRGQRLLLSTYNRTMKAEISISEMRHEGEDFVCGLPLGQLRDFSSTLPEADTVMLKTDDTGCTIQCGRARFRTRLLLEDAFPRAVDIDGNPVDHAALAHRKINLGFLFQSIGLVQHCVDPASQRPYAQGVIITPKVIAATDGMRLSKVPDEWIKPEKPIALTHESVTRLQKLFKGFGDGGVLLRPGELLLSGGGITAVTRLAAWPIPNIESAVPQKGLDTVSALAEDLIQALERALIIAEDKAPQTELEFTGHGFLKLLTEEDGQLSEDVVNVEGLARISIRVNPRFLLDAVKSIESEKVVFQIKAPEAPLLVTNEAGDHVNVIMPLNSAH